MSARRWAAQHLLDFTGESKGKLKRLAPTPEADIIAPLKKLLDMHRNVALWRRMNAGAGFFVPYSVMEVIIECLGGRAAFERRFGRQRWLTLADEGTSDFIGMLKDGRFLALETKSGRYVPSQVSEEQRSFLRVVNQGGGLGFVGSDLGRIEAILSGKVEPEETKAGFLV